MATVWCLNCGAPLHTEANSCYACGAPIQKSPVTPQSMRSESAPITLITKQILRWFAVLPGGILAAAVVMFPVHWAAMPLESLERLGAAFSRINRIHFHGADWLGGNGLGLTASDRRYTLAVVGRSVAARIRRHLLPVYDNRRSTVSSRLKKGRSVRTFHKPPLHRMVTR
jgi:hypothetical protein